MYISLFKDSYVYGVDTYVATYRIYPNKAGLIQIPGPE